MLTDALCCELQCTKTYKINNLKRKVWQTYVTMMLGHDCPQGPTNKYPARNDILIQPHSHRTLGPRSDLHAIAALYHSMYPLNPLL